MADFGRTVLGYKVYLLALTLILKYGVVIRSINFVSERLVFKSY